MYQILNLGAGKIIPCKTDLFPKHDYKIKINLDKNYFSGLTGEEIEKKFGRVEILNGDVDVYCKEDMFNFLERTRMIFNIIQLYRVLEHVSYTKVLYFIYLLSTCLKDGSVVDVIVPNYLALSKRILEEDVYSKNFEEENIITTTELLNEPNDPHASIWTPDRLKYYFEYEKRFKTVEIKDPFEFDGRNIYTNYIARKK